MAPGRRLRRLSRQPLGHVGLDRLEARRLLAGDLTGFVGPLPIEATATDPAVVEAAASLSIGSTLDTAAISPPDLTANAVLALHDQVQSYATLPSTAVTMTGRSELWITGSTSPVTGSTFNLNSEDAWLFFPNIKPSVVNSTYLSQVRVSGRTAVAGSTVRVVQYGVGTVVIPHAPSFKPLEVFAGPNFTGSSTQFGQYTYYNSSSTLGSMQGAISSFRLARGYMATFATQSNGSGVSKVYVAQDSDLDISFLPGELDNAVQFVRVIPWRWVSKKGASDLSADVLDAAWKYNWNNNLDSTLDWEYVPIRQQLYWPGLPTSKQNVTSILGFNEPNNPVEDAYQTLGNGSVDAAIAYWPNMLSTGLRVGSPAVTDGGKAWLYEFMDKAIAANLRVDYIAIHNYQANHTASSLSNWLKDIYDRYHLPIWLTEFNNGANWTSAPDPTLQQNATWVSSITDMLDATPWIERYSIYSNVEAVRQMVDGSGNLTPAGLVYKNNASPIGYVQELPAADSGSGRHVAQLPFEGDSLDTSGYGNNGQLVGAGEFVAGQQGQALRFDGSTTYLQLPQDVAGGSAFTFAAWVNWEGGGNWQRIFDFGGGTNSYMFLTASNGSSLRFAIKNGGSEQRVETTALPVGQWTHVAVTLGGNVARLYVNGTLAAVNTAVTINPGSLALDANFLGKSQFSADPLFKGTLDSVLLTDTALTPTQIAGLAGNSPPVFQAATITTPPAGRGLPVTGSLAGQASDPNTGDTLAYSKIYGPAWLTVASNGSYSGVMGSTDVGQQEFLVAATDSRGSVAYATLVVPVAEAFWRGDLSGIWTAASGGNTNWSSDVAGGTDLGSLPDASTDVVFAASSASNLPNVTLGGDVAVRSLRVTAATGVSLRGSNSIAIGPLGLELTPGSGTSSILTTGGVDLASSQAWTLASDLTVNAPITGSGGLTKTGAGTLLLVGNASYTGGTTIAEGTFRIGSGGSTGSLAGDIVNNATLLVDRSTDLELPGRISGTGSLTKTGGGRLILSTTNAFTGGTTIGSNAGAGVVRATASNALGSGEIVIGPGGNATTARLELASGVTLSNPITLPMRNTATPAIQNVAGTNTLTGTITLNVGGGAAVFQSDAGLLALGSITSAASGDRTITLQGSGDGRLVGTISNGSGTVAVTKNGLGTWTLSGAGTYSGDTTINAGTLALAGSNRIADGSDLVLAGGTFATAGFSETVASISLSGNATIDLGAGASTLRATAAGSFTAGRTLQFVNWTAGDDRVFIGSTATLTPAQLAQITIDGAAVEQTATGEIVPVAVANPDTTLSVGSGDAVIAPALAGEGRLIKQGDGLLVLDSANTHAGGTVVEAGTVEIRNAAALGSGPLRVLAGATVRLDVGLAPVALAGLELADGAVLDLGEGGLEIAAGGATEAATRTWLLAGRAGGSWFGSSGIRSTAVALATGSRTVGYLVRPDGSARILWTAIGDLDLDRDVDAFDLIAMNSAGRYGTGQTAAWSQGDINYDGQATVFDLVGINSGGGYGSGPISGGSLSGGGLSATSAETSAPAEAGLDAARLTAFSQFAVGQLFDQPADDE